ncbi:MAG: hypothetical protein GY714_02065 [Desulfobacterales bacterium]|nr:hypothetical protein [Desulfobacterales bacterium]
MENETSINEICDDVLNYLGYISSSGCKGFDSSSDILNIVNNLDQIKVKLKQNVVDSKVDVKNKGSKCNDCILSGDFINGLGNSNSKIVFICESPDIEKNLMDENNDTGKLFLKMMEAIGITKNDIYITYLLRCTVPEHILPSENDYTLCSSELENEISSIKPSVICALGSNVTRILMKKEGSVSDLRGHFFEYGRSVLYPTFNPSFLIKHSERKKDAWSDLKKLQEKLSEI